ncbi:MAG TPA: biopolymer transporter ExbD, partial [Rheinheimera sp.]|nr:biopolymer transporter ExbD [Rheinheimera sp.]
MIKRRKAQIADAELDITSFMNLMIVLVPVLLLSLVFAQIRVLNIQLPPLSEQQLQQEQEQPQQLELEI